MSKPANKEVGVLWVNEYTKDGEKKKMLSGKVDLGIYGEVDIAVFPNGNKKESKHPDYKIFLSSGNGKESKEKESGKQDLKPF